MVHSDLPQALEDEYGGWISRKVVYGAELAFSFASVEAVGTTYAIFDVKKLPICGYREDFTAYADVCFREFGGRILYWSTFNEANVFVLGGYDVGFTPPKRCSPPFGIANCSKGNSSSEPYVAA